MDSRFIIRRAEVLNVYDDAEGMRIKVRIPGGGDATKSDQELDYCYPLLPKLLHVNPKVGETVLLLTEKLGASDSQRYFIGPLLSQPYNYYHEYDKISANSLLIDNKDNMKPLPAPSQNSANDGTLPDREDIAILGRRNTDIIQKDNEVWIRCGIKENPGNTPPSNLKFNLVDPAFIQMKYYDNAAKTEQNGEFRSVINVVADRINLISPRQGRPMFDGIPNPDSMISDNTLFADENGRNIICDAHPMAYGDTLMSYIRELIEVFRTHTHPFSMLPPTFNQHDTDVLKTAENEDQFLSSTIRCN